MHEPKSERDKSTAEASNGPANGIERLNHSLEVLDLLADLEQACLGQVLARYRTS